MNWSVRRDKKYRLAIASLLEQYPNRVEIVQLDDSNGEIRSDPNLSFEHPYPPTKTIFILDKECQKPDLLATSSDFLRVQFLTSMVRLRLKDGGANVAEAARMGLELRTVIIIIVFQSFVLKLQQVRSELGDPSDGFDGPSPMLVWYT